jgi:type VI secretion system secreted protein VgrG
MATSIGRITSVVGGGGGQASGGTAPAASTGLRKAEVTALDLETFKVKIKIPSLHEEGKQETFWAEVMQPMMGQAEWGFHFMPELGDKVVVAFLDGDFNAPVVVGAAYFHFKPPLKAPVTNEDTDLSFTDEANDVRAIVTRSKHHLIFSDKSGEELVEIRTSSGHVLCLNDKGGSEKLQLYDKDRQQWLEVDVPGKKITLQTDSGEIYVKAKTKITMECEDFILNASKTIKVESGTSSEWKAGSTMKQESGGTFDIEAGGTLTQKAPKIDLNP